jgi:hypothetical protein
MEAWWATELVLALWRRDERLAHDENSTTIRWSSGQQRICYSSRIIYFLCTLKMFFVLRCSFYKKDIYPVVFFKFILVDSVFRNTDLEKYKQGVLQCE